MSIVSPKELQVFTPSDPSRPLACLSSGGESSSERQQLELRGRQPHDEVAWFLLPLQVALVGGSLFRLLSFVQLTKLEQMLKQQKHMNVGV